jgi:hypothetical protein
VKISALTYWTLDADHKPVPTDDVTVWARFFENMTNRLVDYTEITSQVRVSTVFLGLDHRFGGNGPPVIFETMIFGGELDGDTWRYSSWDDAKIGHKGAVRKARAALKAAHHQNAQRRGQCFT